MRRRRRRGRGLAWRGAGPARRRTGAAQAGRAEGPVGRWREAGTREAAGLGGGRGWTWWDGRGEPVTGGEAA
jgi:hypothetical protein